MWIVNWGRLVVFVALAVGLYFGSKGLFAITKETPWPAIGLMAFGFLVALFTALIDRR